MSVYEPPEVSGRANVLEPISSGRIIQNVARLRELAMNSVERFSLTAQTGLFTRNRLLEPLLAREGNSRGRPYFIMPFGEHLTQVSAALILNAYTGDFEEAIILPEGCVLHYLNKTQALEKAIQQLRVPISWLGTPTLLHVLSPTTPNRFIPVWKSELNRSVFITSQGEVIEKIGA